MTKEEILQNATQRPWLVKRPNYDSTFAPAICADIDGIKFPICGGVDAPQATGLRYGATVSANADLIVLAVNSYEADQALIADMTFALTEAHKYFRNRSGNEEVQLSEIIGAALAAAERRKG